MSLTKKGKNGVAEIVEMMENLRSNPPKTLVGFKVVKMADYENNTMFDFTTNTRLNIDLPKSNVLQFFLSDGSSFTARPSGTEPKIKFYFGLKEVIKSPDDFEIANNYFKTKSRLV